MYSVEIKVRKDGAQVARAAGEGVALDEAFSNALSDAREKVEPLRAGPLGVAFGNDEKKPDPEDY